MRAAFDAMGERPPGLRLHCANAIPHARGLGSSSAAIVGGIALARGLVAGGTLLLDDDAAFRLAARLEGHPDNVAPAWYGGFVVSGRDGRGLLGGAGLGRPAGLGRGVRAAHPGVDRGCAAAAARTPSRTRTPPPTPAGPRCSWPRSPDVPSTCYRPPGTGCTRTYRRPAMPESLDLVDALRARGVAAVVSGAGPTVLAFCAGCDAAELRRGAPDGWRSLSLEVSRDGVRVA